MVVRLAGPVGSEEAEDLAPVHLEADAGQRVDGRLGVALDQVGDLDGSVRRHRDGDGRRCGPVARTRIEEAVAGPIVGCCHDPRAPRSGFPDASSTSQGIGTDVPPVPGMTSGPPQT